VRKGTSLTEVLTAIVVAALLLGIGVPEFLKWQLREKVKEDVNFIYALLQTLRNRAFTRKVSYAITIGGTMIRVEGTENATYSLNFPFETSGRSSLYVSSKGIFSKQTTIKCCEPACRRAAYNCVVVNFCNLRIDKCSCR